MTTEQMELSRDASMDNVTTTVTDGEALPQKRRILSIQSHVVSGCELYSI
jgi:hypothetical protein